eukprot:5208579-Pleurochrysis_carterae.AAC.1
MKLAVMRVVELVNFASRLCSQDAFETTMWTLRRRLAGASGDSSSWMADVSSCVSLHGDEAELDLDAIRAEVLAEGDVFLSEDARAVLDILSEWASTRDDRTFAMRTRYFPSGVKPPGAGQWT